MARYRPENLGDYVPLAPRTANTENDDNTLEYEQPKPKTRYFWHRLGPTHLFILFLGSAILPLVLLAAALLWKESMIAITGAEPRMPWIRLLSANWATSVVTICTAIVRTLVTLQAGLVTAMLAGIILETIGTTVFQGPLYSIIRALEVAPSNLLSAATFQPKDVLSFLTHTLVFIEVLVTVASQFLSTILISDFADGTFANMENFTNVRTMERPDIYKFNGWWTVPPASSWTFAELSESFAEGQNFHDTGHTYRAFLPFEDEAQRTKLRKFRGPALVMDQRVVCVRPSLINLTLNSFSEASPRLSGQIAIDTSSYPMFQETKTQEYTNFICSLPDVRARTNNTHRESSLCLPDTGADWTVLLEDPLVDPGTEVPGTFDILKDIDPMLGTPKISTMFMVLDVVNGEAISNGHDPKRVVDVVRNNGTWAMIANGSATEALRLTACITNFGAQTFTVDIHGSRERLEPKMLWNTHGPSLPVYNTEAVRRQLGASLTPESLENRGVLRLEPRSQWQDYISDYYGNDWHTHEWFFYMALAKSMSRPYPRAHPGNETAALGVTLSSIQSTGDNDAHEAHASVFQDTLNATGSPAFATQAILARIHQMAYYEELPKQDSRVAGLTSFSTSALVPVRWIGFIVATVLVATHFIVVVIVTVLFLGFTKHSLIGNSWQAVSQIVSEDTLPILEQANRMKDKDVRRWAKRQSLGLMRYGVLRYRRDGRVALDMQGGNT